MILTKQHEGKTGTIFGNLHSRDSDVYFIYLPVGTSEGKKRIVAIN